jgi:hypothetical protein
VAGTWLRRASSSRTPSATFINSSGVASFLIWFALVQLRETRHTAVSVLSSYGVPIEHISDVVGQPNANITKAVHRHQLGDDIAAAALAWDAFTAATTAPADGSS